MREDLPDGGGIVEGGDHPQPAPAVRARHDRRVRLAASHAIDRQALNEAEMLGLSRSTGALIPRVLDFARHIKGFSYSAPHEDPKLKAR